MSLLLIIGLIIGWSIWEDGRAEREAGRAAERFMEGVKNWRDAVDEAESALDKGP